MLGYWLGDAVNRDPVITSQDSTVLHYFNKNVKKYDLSLNFQSGYTYRISGYTGKYGSNVFLNTIIKQIQIDPNLKIPSQPNYFNLTSNLKFHE
jgi:hypothetical protein